MLRARPSDLARMKGFTLIEVMVVLVIIGIATSAIGLSIAPDPSRALRREAQELAQRFIVAQSEVQLDGRAIVWQTDQDGYHFSRRSWRSDGRVVPTLGLNGPFDRFEHDDMLRPRRWQAPPIHMPGSRNQTVVFNREPLGIPWKLVLASGTATVSVVRDAAGRFSVE